MGKEKVEVKEKIIVEGVLIDNEKIVKGYFFTIDMKNNIASRWAYPLLGEEGVSTLATIGSVVYVVGVSPNLLWTKHPSNSPSSGLGLFHTGFSYLDLDPDPDPDPAVPRDWKAGPCEPTLVQTCLPAVVTLGGKLYVFVSGTKSKVAGVFDPASNTWTKLLPPYEVAHFSIHPPPFRGVLADHARNRILLYFHHITSTYAYYPALDQWKLLFDDLIWSPKPVFANGIFYFYKLMTQNMVCAFDEKTKSWLEIELTSPVPYEVWAKKYDDMFYLGDGLVCFASYRAFYQRERDLSSTTVYLSKFRFQRTNASPPRLLITPLPTETYKLDKGLPIVNYLPF